MGIASENYPFCTIEANVGAVAIPDPRLETINRYVKTEKIIPAIFQLVDIAGLVRGASKGEGLGNQFLANIRQVDAVLHVLRCFDDPNVTHVEGGVDPKRVVVFGRSLGGPIAATLAAEVDPAALIVESTFTAAGDLAASLYPWLPARTLLRFRYDTRARLRERSCPLLIVHSEDDELVGYEHALALYADAPEPKQLLTIHGAHASGFLTSGALYRDGVAAFIAKVV